MAAARFELDNLVAIVDRNGVCMDGFTEEIMPLGDLRQKMEAFGWAVREIDGHDITAILNTLSAVPFEPKKPSAIIAKTVKGKGVSFMENTCEWHHKEVSPEVTERALQEIQ